MSRLLEAGRKAEEGGSTRTLASPLPGVRQHGDGTSERLQPQPRPSPFTLERKQPDWLRTLSAVARHWRWSGSFAGIVIAAATVAAFRMSPVYEPIARIEVDPPGAEMFSLQGGESRLEYLAEYLETQAKALQSDELAIQVIRKLQLDQHSEFV